MQLSVNKHSDERLVTGDIWCPTFASSKISRRVFSDSPDIPETMEGAEMLRKGVPSSWRDQYFYLTSCSF